MSKKAIIFDLDNTIYSVASIGNNLFASLFQLITETGEHNTNIDAIKDDIMRKPFQLVASNHNFSDELKQKCIDLLKHLTYDGPIEPFSDYSYIKDLPFDKFLVTTGFFNLQQSKIKGMGIEKDFKEIHIVDPATSDRTKKDVFADIVNRNGYHTLEVLVVGDDPDSEIKAAQDLEIETVLYDKFNLHSDDNILCKISDFTQLIDFV